MLGPKLINKFVSERPSTPELVRDTDTRLNRLTETAAEFVRVSKQAQARPSKKRKSVQTLRAKTSIAAQKAKKAKKAAAYESQVLS